MELCGAALSKQIFDFQIQTSINPEEVTEMGEEVSTSQEAGGQNFSVFHITLKTQSLMPSTCGVNTY